jgi:hypothetical protein
VKKLFHLALTITALGAFLIGCERSQNPVESLSSEKVALSSSVNAAIQSLAPTDITLAGFQVHYNGRTVESGFTTFTYTVTGPAVAMHFRLELPSCAPAFSAVSPSNGTTTNNDDHINPGVEWHPSTGSGETNTFTFSITYPGTVREGIVLVSVKSNNTTEVGEITGACARVFDISGTVFTEANSNGLFDSGETGIKNATVDLFDSENTVVGTTATNSNGFYIFEAFPAGNYTIQVNAGTVVSTSNKYLEATAPTSIAVAIGPDATENNFGFAPKTSQIINDLKRKVLLSNGKAATFWKKELKIAITGKGKPEVSKALLQSYVSQIRAFLLFEPFQLPGGDGLQAAYDIVDRPVKTDLDKLKRELLAAEFNHMNTRGIIGTDEALQLILLGWGESLVQSNSTTSAANLRKTTSNAAVTAAASTVSEAVDLFTQLNSSGGGSGGGPR